MRKQSVVLLVLVLFLLAPMFVFAGGQEEKAPAEKTETKEFSWRQQEGAEINVYLTNWHMTTMIKEKIQEFEELTGIKANIQGFADDQLDKKVTTELIAKSSGIDVFQSRPWNSGRKYWISGWYEPLDKFIDDPMMTNADFDYNDFFGWAKQASSYDGQVAGLTINAATFMLFYRDDLFQEYGVKPPETLDELMEAAKQLTLDTDNDGKTDIYGFTARGKAGHGEALWGCFLRNMGGQWLDENRDPIFNKDGGAESLEYFAELVQNYGPPGVANYGWQESLALFNDGKAAMIMDASPLFANMIDPKQSKVHEHVKALIQPEGPAGNYPTVHGWTLNMSPFSKNKEAAWLFMQWYSSKDMYKYAYSNGFPTPRKSAWNQPNAKEMAPESSWYEATLASFEIGGFWIIPIVVAGAEVRKEIGLAVSSALEGADNYQELLDSAAERVKNIMEKTEQ